MRRIVDIPLNRVEGDLEIQVTLEDGVVVEARTSGTLYRGFEQLMVGRHPRDALVITPRVCGICSTAHLYAAVLALEDAWGTPVPPNATRVRNACLMAEGVQSDLRQTFLFFAPDFCHPRHAGLARRAEAMAAFEPFRGKIHQACIDMSRKVVEIVAVFGGQWPHSSYMLPGGVVSRPDERRLSDCWSVLETVRTWFEHEVLGMRIDAWLGIVDPDHPAAAGTGGALALLDDLARGAGLHRVGAGSADFLAFGSWCDPDAWAPGAPNYLLPGGVFLGGEEKVAPLDTAQINEHVRHSWFRPYAGGRHPFDGETVPDYQPGNDRYTWAKAPRYGDRAMQTGPLAQLLVAGDPLISGMRRRDGDGAWLQQFARVRRCALQLHRLAGTLDELVARLDEDHILPPSPGSERDAQGQGLIMVTRGALGHWLRIEDGRIAGYQIITPTAWNASPSDDAGQPGHWERSLVGLAVADPDDPIEIAQVIRAHDPCLVCTVHMLGNGRRFVHGI